MPSHLKNLIRARMTKTGESWSTAARQVRAQAPLIKSGEATPRETDAAAVSVQPSRDGAAGAEALTFGQLLAGLNDLFAECREGPTFITEVNSLRRPDPYRPGGPIPEVPLVRVAFERTELGWVFAGTLIFVDGEVRDGADKLDPAWLSTDAGRDRVQRALRGEVATRYRPLAAVLTDLSVSGGRARATNVLIDATLTFAHPLYALLHRLQVTSTFVVETGRVPAVGVSANARIADEQAQRLASNPQWYAETGGVQMSVSKADHERLVAAGAAVARETQIMRSFRTEQGTTFAHPCANCRRWVSCGTVERKGACVCGHEYRVTFDLPPIKHWTLHRGPCCMDCGNEMSGMREWVGSRQPWRLINEGQHQCDPCYLNRNIREAGRRLGEVQHRSLRTKPTIGDPEPTDPNDLAALADADRRHREAIAARWGQG